MDGKVRVWRRVKGKNSDASTGGAAADLSGWQNWEFLTSLDTSDEVTVSGNWVQGASSPYDR
jgi:ribosome assembly protein SQT1